MENFKNNNKKICIYCGKKLETPTDTTCDHLVPISRKGVTSLENLGLSCEHCNKEKSDMTPDEYTEYLKLKEHTLHNNVILSELNKLTVTYQNIISGYEKNNEDIEILRKDKIEIENIIMDDIFNASQGFCLCRDLKNTLRGLHEKQNIKSSSRRSYDFSKSNIDAVIEEKKHLERILMNNIRSEYSIGRIGQLGIEKIEFKF